MFGLKISLGLLFELMEWIYI